MLITTTLSPHPPQGAAQRGCTQAALRPASVPRPRPSCHMTEALLCHQLSPDLWERPSDRDVLQS